MIKKLVNKIINTGWRNGSFFGVVWYILGNPRGCIGFVVFGIEIIIKVTEIKE